MLSSLTIALALLTQLQGKEAGSLEAARALAAQRARAAEYAADLKRSKLLIPHPKTVSDPKLLVSRESERRKKLQESIAALRKMKPSNETEAQLARRELASIASGESETIDYHSPQAKSIGLVRYSGDRIPTGVVLQIVESMPLVRFPNGRVVWVECDSRGLTDNDHVRFDNPVHVFGTLTYQNALRQSLTVQRWRVLPQTQARPLPLPLDVVPDEDALRLFKGQWVTFVKRDGSSAVLRNKAGATAKVPLGALGESDREWARRRERTTRSTRWLSQPLVTPPTGFRTIDASASGSYVLRFKAIRKKTNYAFGAVIPVADRHCQIHLSLNGNRRHGIDLIDGREAAKNGEYVHASRLKNGVAHQIEVRVTVKNAEQTAIIEVCVNRERILRWEGLIARLSTHPRYAIEKARFAFVAMCPVDYKEIALLKR